MEREALKLALEALTIQSDRVTEIGKKREAITAIKEALAQPAQEPVAFEEWLSKQHGDPEEIGFLQALRIAYISGQDSIITPPQRKPLTDEEISNIWCEVSNTDFVTADTHEFARAIEAKLKEKNA